MIEFKVDSLGKNSETGTFWQGLNAASVALQQAAQSEAVVYQVFSEQLVKLGLHGSVSLLDETGETLRIASIVFSKKLMQLVQQAEKLLGISSVGYTYPAQASLSEGIVLKGDIVFLEDNSEKMRQVIPPRIFRYAAPFMKPFLNIPAVLAPIFTQSKVVGLLYLAGSKIVVEDVPAIAAFATHLSIALENARLFQAVQQAETQYRQLFESANDGIFTLDPVTHILLSANTKMLLMLGISEDELGKVKPPNRVPAQISSLYLEHLEKAIKEGAHFFEVPFVDQDGRTYHWQISANMVELNGTRVLNGVVRDVTAAKKAEQVLRQREEQFRVLAENVPGTIYLCKNEPGLPFLYINDGIETLTGYSKDKFIRQDLIFHELIHPEDLVDKKTPLNIVDIQQKQTIQHVYRVQHRSGVWRWVEDIVGGVFDEQGNLLFLEGVISDITERFQADLLQKTVYRIAAVAHTSISLDELYQAIHESLALILDVKNFYIALYDRLTDKIDVPYFVDKLSANAEAYPDSAALAEIVIRSNSSHLLTQLQIAAKIEQNNLDVQGILPQVWLGVPLQGQAGAIGALVVQSYEASTAYSEQDRQFLTFVSEQIASVIERKRAEERRLQLSEKLTQQTRLLEAILVTTPDSFLVFDLNGRFQFASSAILNFWGVTGDQVVGKTWRELNLPESIGVLSDQDRAAVLQTGKPVSREIKYAMPEGELEIELVTNPVLDNGGKIISFVITARDITERRQTVHAMHRAQKMESLGVLAGGIAHDFNNLLVAMLGQASLAQAYLEESHPAYGHVSKMVQASEQAATLTRQLLAYSGGGQFTIRSLHLNQLINESVELLRVALPKQVRLQLDLASHLPHIEADVAQIQQVLMNLIINAAEAVGEQPGTIWINTAVHHLPHSDDHFSRYTDKALQFGKYVKLGVRDTGQGMDEETIAKIFDPFFTTKFTGRGLGLAAVLGIIRGHNGGLHVTSEPGVGTTFELLFPASGAITETMKESPMPEMKVEKRLVLVIDDEKAVREAVFDILEMEGIDVLTAANGDEGIKIYQARSKEIDLVLLDLSMPGKNGHETFQELQAFDPDVRIMLSSGYSEADATRGFNSPPLVGFLQKPYRLEKFVQQLWECL